MERVIAQDFSGKFTLQIQKLPEVSVIHSATPQLNLSSKSQPQTPILLAVQLPLTWLLGFPGLP